LRLHDLAPKVVIAVGHKSGVQLVNQLLAPVLEAERAVNLVDFAKDLHRAAVDLIHPQRVVFHHVPKCGGTSVGRALRKRYLLSQSTVSPQSSFRAIEILAGSRQGDDLLPDVAKLREQMLLYLMLEDVRCISVHVWFSETAYDYFKDSYKFITILREPISRFISNYRWLFMREGDHGRIDLPLEEFLNTDRAWGFGSMYVRYFAGHGWNSEARSTDAIRSAIRNLEKFDVVGQLQDLHGLEADIRKALGIRLQIGHENRSKSSSDRCGGEIDPSLRARIEQICGPDLEIWQHFQGIRNATER
jgi:Sulfotransferase family